MYIRCILCVYNCIYIYNVFTFTCLNHIYLALTILTIYGTKWDVYVFCRDTRSEWERDDMWCIYRSLSSKTTNLIILPWLGGVAIVVEAPKFELFQKCRLPQIIHGIWIWASNQPWRWRRFPRSEPSKKRDLIADVNRWSICPIFWASPNQLHQPG